MGQVLDLLGESVGEPREASHSHAHGEVLPLDVAGRDLGMVGFPGNDPHVDKLNVLPQRRMRSLFVQYSRAGYNQGEPSALSPEIPTVVNNAIGVHLGEQEYTIPELASVVYLFPDEFSELYDLRDGGQQQHLRIV